MSKTYAIVDDRNDWYAATDDANLSIPVGHRLIPIDDALSLSRSYQEWQDDALLLKAKIAEIRYEKESAGIYVGEQHVSTNRDEMPVWQGMLLDMTFRPGVRTEYEYKPREGVNTTLTPQQVMRCYECFAWYVAACFGTERQLQLAIDAGTPLADVVAMLETVWPQQKFEWIPG